MFVRRNPGAIYCKHFDVLNTFRLLRVFRVLFLSVDGLSLYLKAGLELKNKAFYLICEFLRKIIKMKAGTRRITESIWDDTCAKKLYNTLLWNLQIHCPVNNRYILTIKKSEIFYSSLFLSRI